MLHAGNRFPFIKHSSICVTHPCWHTLCFAVLSHPVVSNSCPGTNTGVGCHALLQGIFPTQGWNPGLLHCRWVLYHLSHQGSPGEILLIHFSAVFSPVTLHLILVTETKLFSFSSYIYLPLFIFIFPEMFTPTFAYLRHTSPNSPFLPEHKHTHPLGSNNYFFWTTFRTFSWTSFHFMYYLIPCIYFHFALFLEEFGSNYK